MARVPSDKYAQYKKDRQEMYDHMGIDVPNGTECTPVDMNGHRVNLDQNDPTNLAKTADDIQDTYGLTPSPNEPDNGGLASEDKDDSY